MPETTRPMDRELEEVRDQIRSLAEQANDAIRRASQALLDGGTEAAQAVIEGDDAIDRLSVDIDEHCCRMLVLENTMAKDLREIVAAIWINAELERSADLATNICKGRRRIYDTELDDRLQALIREMCDEAEQLTRFAVDSFLEKNAGLAGALRDLDDRLDALHATFMHAVFDAHHDGRLELQPAVQLALIGRFYERMGDHAVNIGDRVRYMIEASRSARDPG